MRFEALYQGTWSLDPKIDELKVIELQPGVVQLYVPITFMISPAGQVAQPTRFLMNHETARVYRGARRCGGVAACGAGAAAAGEDPAPGCFAARHATYSPR